ncbi:MAG TPA: hypothetical protein VI260_28195 [Blastocatellia bacterium]
MKRTEQEGPPIAQRAFYFETCPLLILVPTTIATAVVIGESAIRLGVPTTEPFAVVAAAIAEAGIAEQIEPAMLKGVFPAPYQPVTVTTAFFKSLPMAVFPIVAVTVIVFPIVAVTIIVFPIVMVTIIVFPIVAVTIIIFPIVAVTIIIFPIVTVTIIVFPIIAISAIILRAVAVTVAPSHILSKGH